MARRAVYLSKSRGVRSSGEIFILFFFQDLKSIDAVLIRILPCAYARYARREHNETRGDPVRNAESALFNHPVKASNA